MAVSEAVTFLNVVSGPTTPVAHLAVILAPSMNSMVANGNLSFVSSFALEIGGLVHVMVDATMNASDGISGSKMVRTSIHH